MKILDHIENKIKLALVVAVSSLIASVIISAFALYSASGIVERATGSIYVLQEDMPLKARRIKEDRRQEYGAHVRLFHMLFFNLPPDDAFITTSLEKAMYLVDESGVREYNTLKEKGYYNQILSSSAVLSLQGDSVRIDKDRFMYYGTQRIERGSTIQYRRLVTTGSLRQVPRSENNPHGLIITGWKTLDNTAIRDERKRSF